MQQQRHGAIGRAGFGVADVEHAGLDLLERGEAGMAARLGGRQRGRLGDGGLRLSGLR
ncbi:hypothetical protein D3C86_1611950 [compost metagenome]